VFAARDPPFENTPLLSVLLVTYSTVFNLPSFDSKKKLGSSKSNLTHGIIDSIKNIISVWVDSAVRLHGIMILLCFSLIRADDRLVLRLCQSC